MPRKKVAPQAAHTPQSVAAYIRVSTEEQAQSGAGLDAQRTRVAAMAAVKDWPTPMIYADEGISGTKDATKRPQLASLLTAVRAGTIDAVIIPSLDRLGRKTRLVLDLVDELARYDVALVSCKETLDTSTPQGQFVLTMFAALAQLERDLISERTSAALAELERQGKDKGGRLPFGYVRTGAGIVVDEHQARVVRQIFALHHAGLSLRKIAADLPLPAPHGTRWHASSVASVLANQAAYRGESQVCWPPILPVVEAKAHPAPPTSVSVLEQADGYSFRP